MRIFHNKISSLPKKLQSIEMWVILRSCRRNPNSHHQDQPPRQYFGLRKHDCALPLARQDSPSSDAIFGLVDFEFKVLEGIALSVPRTVLFWYRYDQYIRCGIDEAIPSDEWL